MLKTGKFVELFDTTNQGNQARDEGIDELLFCGYNTRSVIQMM